MDKLVGSLSLNSALNPSPELTIEFISVGLSILGLLFYSKIKIIQDFNDSYPNTSS